jgi:heat shock protein HslJ
MPSVAGLPSMRAAAAGVTALLLLAGAAVAQDGSSQTASPPPSEAPALLASPAPVGSALDGNWEVRQFLSRAGEIVEPITPSGLSARLLPDGDLEGETGCESYVGSYQLDGQMISLSVLGRDPRPCASDVKDEAEMFIEALKAVTAWRLAGSGLELLDDTGRVQIGLLPAPIAGPQGEWSVTSFARPNGKLQAAPTDGSMRLVLGADGTARGATGCRLFEGEYMAQSEQMLIVPLDITGLPCRGDVRRSERRLLAAFERVVLWQRDGTTMHFTDGNGQVVMELTASPASLASPLPSTAPTEG